jgi:hypothetical protein
VIDGLRHSIDDRRIEKLTIGKITIGDWASPPIINRH